MARPAFEAARRRRRSRRCEANFYGGEQALRKNAKDEAIALRHDERAGVVALAAQAKSESMSWKRSKLTLWASALTSRSCTRIGRRNRAGRGAPGSLGRRLLAPA